MLSGPPGECRAIPGSLTWRGVELYIDAARRASPQRHHRPPEVLQHVELVSGAEDNVQAACLPGLYPLRMPCAPLQAPGLIGCLKATEVARLAGT